MKYVDGIQPPLALYGNLEIIDGHMYYCEDGKDNVRYAPKQWIIQRYYKRLQDEKQETHPAQNSPTGKAEAAQGPFTDARTDGGAGSGGLPDENQPGQEDDFDPQELDVELNEPDPRQVHYDTEIQPYPTYPVGTHISFTQKVKQALTGKK